MNGSKGSCHCWVLFHHGMIGSKGSCHCWVLFHHKEPWNDWV